MREGHQWICSEHKDNCGLVLQKKLSCIMTGPWTITRAYQREVLQIDSESAGKEEDGGAGEGVWDI